MKLLKFALLATFLFSFNNAEAATLTESPGNIAQGGSVTATWNGVVAPSNRDWIGLYKPSEPDTSTNFIDWIYDNSCNRAGNNSVLAAGSCPFTIPTTLANGTYELRLYANNNYILLAKSGPFTVSAVRYVDNGDGTITDLQTGPMWEKKTGSVGSAVNCTSHAVCPDIHNVNNKYLWSVFGAANVANDGALFTDFLANLTLSTSANGTALTNTCLAEHCDWRIPDINELKTILASCPGSGPGPCIDPIFGPTQPSVYWSSTSGSGGSGALGRQLLWRQRNHPQ